MKTTKKIVQLGQAEGVADWFWAELLFTHYKDDQYHIIKNRNGIEGRVSEEVLRKEIKRHGGKPSDFLEPRQPVEAQKGR